MPSVTCGYKYSFLTSPHSENITTSEILWREVGSSRTG